MRNLRKQLLHSIISRSRLDEWINCNRILFLDEVCVIGILFGEMDKINGWPLPDSMHVIKVTEAMEIHMLIL